MLRFAIFLRLTLCYYTLPLALIHTLADVHQDCQAALDLIPRTNLELDPHDMAINYKDPDSENRISLRLTGKHTTRISSAHIRLPATFVAGRCVIEVYPLPRPNIPAPAPMKELRTSFSRPFNLAYILHTDFWPHIRSNVKELIADRDKRPFISLLEFSYLHTALGTIAFGYRIVTLNEVPSLARLLTVPFLNETNIYSATGQLYKPVGALIGTRI